MTIAHSIIRAMAKDVLLNPLDREWTIQGLGMLRTYFGPEVRLHIWDQRFAWCTNSRLHTHPWDFRSLIAAGLVRQRRFIEVDDQLHVDAINHTLDLSGQMRYGNPEPYLKNVLTCGYEGSLKSDATLVHLAKGPEEIYGPGEWYGQEADEVHDSTPEDGTVTIIYRTFKNDMDTATVYRPIGTEHENAGARRATEKEVVAITEHALNTWFTP